MFSLTVCANDGKCCVTAVGTISLASSADPAPVRVFLGLGKNCNATPPIPNLGGTPGAGWIEDSSIHYIGSDKYNIEFPPISSGDSRCVEPCDQAMNVAIWTYYSDGSSSCQQVSAFNPATYCAAQSMGVCPECAEIL